MRTTATCCGRSSRFLRLHAHRTPATAASFCSSRSFERGRRAERRSRARFDDDSRCSRPWSSAIRRDGARRGGSCAAGVAAATSSSASRHCSPHRPSTRAITQRWAWRSSGSAGGSTRCCTRSRAARTLTRCGSRRSSDCGARTPTTPFSRSANRRARYALTGRRCAERSVLDCSPRAQGARSPAAHERVTLLLTTDLLSEGVNLQDASVVVHLDLPWNPARLAQRLGRIRRPGGASEVASYLLSPPAHASLLLRTEARLRAKLARAESTIGRGVDVLPALSAPTLVSAHASKEGMAQVEGGSSLSAAELRGEVARRLARWRRTGGSGDAPPDGGDGR